MAYLVYRVWPAYLKQTTTPSITDFVVRRAPDIAPSVAASAAILFIVALIANAIARQYRSRNLWATAIVFAIAYAALVYGASTNAVIRWRGMAEKSPNAPVSAPVIRYGCRSRPA